MKGHAMKKGGALEFILCLLVSAIFIAGLMWCIGTAADMEDEIRTARLDAHLSPERRAELMRGVEK